MASDSVVWKCGSCDECFYDLQILASHKCIGNDGTVLNESCIKQLEVQSYDCTDLSNSNDQVQDIGSLNIIDGPDITELPYTSTPFHKPTIISIKKNSEFKRHQKGKRSIVWTYFTALDEKKAMCCICQKVISYCGTPTNLVYHLSRYHPIEGDVVKSKQANNIKYQYLSNKLPKPCASEKKKTRTQTISLLPQVTLENSSSLTIVTKKPNVTEKIVEMLLVDMLPVSILEGNGFKSLINSLESSYKMPTVKEFFIDHIPKKYYVEFKKVQSLLKDSEKVHTSIELWTGYNDQNFLTVSSHFVTSDFQYKHYALSTVPVHDKNPEHLMTSIVTCISNWNLSMDVLCIVIDGSDTMEKTAQLTGWTVEKCFAHTLDDIIKVSLSSPELNALFAKCRNIIKFLRSNESAKQLLLEAQMHDKNLKMQHAQNQSFDINAALDIKYPLKVKKDHPNEWISTFYMLQRIATLKEVLIKLLSNFSSSVEMLTQTDWTAIDETISLLKAFEAVTLELCSEPYQFGSKVIPVALGLDALINNCNTLSLSFIEKVRKDILFSLRKRLGKIEHDLMLSMATILDPRFKNIAFQSEVAVEAAITQLTTEASKQVSNDSMMDHSLDKDSRDITTCTDSLWEGFERKATPKKAPSKTEEVISSEIKNYLEESLLDRKKNPFMWWKTQGQAQFPILAKLARKFLCIPATSIPPERVFLKKGRIFSEKRRLIKPKYIDQFVFLNMNID